MEECGTGPEDQYLISANRYLHFLFINKARHYYLPGFCF